MPGALRLQLLLTACTCGNAFRFLLASILACQARYFALKRGAGFGDDQFEGENYFTSIADHGGPILMTSCSQLKKGAVKGALCVGSSAETFWEVRMPRDRSARRPSRSPPWRLTEQIIPCAAWRPSF